MRCSHKSHDGRMGRYRIVRTLLNYGTSPFPPSLLSIDALRQGRFRIHGPTLPGLLRRRHPKRLSPPPLIHPMPTLPASPPTFLRRSVDAHHRSPRPRHWTLVNGERVGRCWDDARPRYVSQISFRPQLNGTAQADVVQGLTGYIKEILDGAMSSPMSFGLLRNDLNDTSGDGQEFPEISGSTLLASVAYRMAVLRPDVFASSSSSSGLLDIEH